MAETAPPSVRRLPLHKLHREWGARFERVDGAEVAASYGAPDREYRALREGCGLVDRSDVARLELMGEDRQRLLNGLVTCDVKALAAGEGAYGYFTDRQGKILADVAVLALADRLWLELPPAAGGAMADHLVKHVIVDRVEVKPLDDLVLWTLAGPRARDLLASFTAEPLPEAPWSHRRVVIGGSEVELARQARLGVDAWTLWTSASIARALAESLRERGAPFGLLRVGREALDIVRVEAGIGRFGRDFGPENLPQEVGEKAAVSYTKGCYLGQEIVARIHYRGGVNNRLTRLSFAPGPPPAAGTALALEEREVGRVTSTASSPRLGAIGLAMVHKRGWDAEILTAGGVSARPLRD